ncbi:hypothetical protein [Sphingobium sp. Leaf26]|nr:hypothetical protein [Sphingobium sp. Leaf26]
MSLLRSLPQRWARLREAARREFLRDPDVVLFERRVEPLGDATHGL